MPVSVSEFGLARVIVRVEVPPMGMLVGAKALEIVGGELTVKVAVAEPSVPPLV